MQSITRSLLRAQFAAMDLIDGAVRRRERGDVPGWVLITLMTAAMVAAIWGFAQGAFERLFDRAISSVDGVR